MNVTLRKITKIPLDFELKSDEINFKGFLEYHSGKLILLNAHMSGFIEKQCDVCAEEFKLPVDEEIKFFLSDGIYEDADNLELEVVESLDGNVDMEEVLASEIELIKCDYHSCENCK